MKKIYLHNKKVSNLIGLIFVTIICCCANPNENKYSYDNYEPIILISIDGFRWDYIDLADTPNFDSIIKTGVKTKGLIPVFPTKTFPNHLSIVTGNYPKNHGIISNRMYDSEFDEIYYIGEGSKPVLDPKWYEAEPIWVTAEKQNKKAMTMFWPGSEAKIMGMYPSEYFVYDGSISHDSRIEQILKWLQYEPKKRPDIITLYFSHVDSQGHKYGPQSDQTTLAIEEMDRVIGKLIYDLNEINILEQINIMITSDHGMASISEDSVIFIDDYINLSSVNIVDWSPVVSIFPNDISNTYNELYNAHPNMKIYKKEDIPLRLKYNDHKRIAPLIGIADEGWSISSKEKFNPTNYNGGTHGYDPQYQSMHGIFIATGPAFESGLKLPHLSSIHLYELMCKIIGITPATNDGSLDSTASFLIR